MATLPVSVEIRNSLAWVTIDNPPVNATSAAVRQGLAAAVEKVSAMPVRAAILRCRGRTFVAGGDITEFDAPPVLPDLPDVIRAIETCPVPWIAALHGSVFGGGLEIALGCAWRVAVCDARFALPEVTLGIVPGAGGTQRLPRLVGVAMAIDMTTSGRPVMADVFNAADGLDAILPDLEDVTLIAFAETLGPRPEPVSARRVDTPDDAWWAEKARDVHAHAAGAAAPMENLTLIARATQATFDRGQPEERARHLALRVSDQSRALRHIFFAERQAARSPALAGQTPPQISGVTLLGVGNLADRLKAEVTAARLAIVSTRGDGPQSDICILTQTKTLLHPKPESDIPLVIAFETGADIPAHPQITPYAPTVNLGFGRARAATLVEIMTHDATPPTTVAASLALVRRLGHVPVFTQGADDFVSVRLCKALCQHAANLSLRGISARQLATSWASFGGTETPFGPTDEGPIPGENKTVDDPQMQGLLAVLVNAGALAVEDGCVQNPASIDVIAVAGCGFPRWRGGPMHYANTLGIDCVSDWMQGVMTDWPGKWRLSTLLRRGSG